MKRITFLTMPTTFQTWLKLRFLIVSCCSLIISVGHAQCFKHHLFTFCIFCCFSHCLCNIVIKKKLLSMQVSRAWRAAVLLVCGNNTKTVISPHFILQLFLPGPMHFTFCNTALWKAKNNTEALSDSYFHILSKFRLSKSKNMPKNTSLLSSFL